MRDSDDDDIHDRDYDVTALANNLSQAFGYKIYGNDDNEEVCFYLDVRVCAFICPPPPPICFSCWILMLDTATYIFWINAIMILITGTWRC